MASKRKLWKVVLHGTDGKTYAPPRKPENQADAYRMARWHTATGFHHSAASIYIDTRDGSGYHLFEKIEAPGGR